ncbi:DNA recombination protein RmuC [Sphingobacterium hungaricum]
MEVIYLCCILILFVALAFLLWKQNKAVSGERYEQLRAENERIKIELAKSQQRESSFEEHYRLSQISLENEREVRMRLDRSLENSNANLQAQYDKLEEQKAEIASIKQQFNLEFQQIANAILEEKTQKFSESNQKNLELILDPLKEKIKLFEEKVDKTYQHEAAERNVLKGVVEQLMQQSQQITNEASNLTRALKGDAKKQGNWGEVILERVLERSGLNKDQEYRLQHSFQEEGAKKIPDAIIDLPDNKQLVIDSKISLVAYERWVNAESEQELKLFAKQHVTSLESHIRDLSSKNYQQIYHINSPDFVLLFMPIESALSLAVREKPELFSEAWDRKVVIVSPSTLLATLRTIASIWKQEKQNRNVLEIAREAGLLYDKFVGFIQDMQQIESSLGKASAKYDDAFKKLASGPGNMVKKMENLKTLGARTNKQIDGKFLED